MSYVRFTEGGSDVYMYPAREDRIVCCACSVNMDDPVFEGPDRYQQAIEHLNLHVDEGDYVPESAFRKLEKEAKEVQA